MNVSGEIFWDVTVLYLCGPKSPPPPAFLGLKERYVIDKDSAPGSSFDYIINIIEFKILTIYFIRVWDKPSSGSDRSVKLSMFRSYGRLSFIGPLCLKHK